MRNCVVVVGLLPIRKAIVADADHLRAEKWRMGHLAGECHGDTVLQACLAVRANSSEAFFVNGAG
jgi:phage FluMu gp28-like protein